MTQFFMKILQKLTKEDKLLVKSLKKIIGFRPNNLSFYKKSFIHKSASKVDLSGKITNNERLEFLGDSVLGSVISEYLFKKYPNYDEGFLTKTKAKIVNATQLASLAEKIGIDKFIITQSESALNKTYLLGDAFEALIGAIYLDKGYKVTNKFIIKNILDKYIDFDDIIKIETNHKSNLIEWSQKTNTLLRFETIPLDENPILFASKIFINDEEIAIDFGTNKKEAEQKASNIALKIVMPSYNNAQKTN